MRRRLYIPSTGPPDITERTDWTVLPYDDPIRQEQERYRAAYNPDMWAYWSREVRECGGTADEQAAGGAAKL